MNFNKPPSSPITPATQWFDHAKQTLDTPNPLSGALATVNEEGQPSSRMVLLKGFDEQGAVFFTNYNSDKSRDIDDNPKVSMLFHWDTLHRQLRIQGVAEKLNEEESDVYFASRPRLSQIGALASDQSKPLQSRAKLLEKVATLTAKWFGRDIPRPENWGGYRIRLTAIEFWEGQDGRLHDRVRYLYDDDWSWERLQP